MKPSKYSVELIKKNGLPHAVQIARQKLEASKPQVWNTLPVGNTFYKDLEGARRLSDKEKATIRTVAFESVDGKKFAKSFVLRLKEIETIFLFWQNVHGILNNRLNKELGLKKGTKNVQARS